MFCIKSKDICILNFKKGMYLQKYLYAMLFWMMIYAKSGLANLEGTIF